MGPALSHYLVFDLPQFLINPLIKPQDRTSMAESGLSFCLRQVASGWPFLIKTLVF